MNKYIFFTILYFSGLLFSHLLVANDDSQTYGNFRVAKVLVKFSVNGQQTVRSENQLTWDARGNMSKQNIKNFHFDNSAAVSSKIIFNDVFNDKHHLIKRLVKTQGDLMSSSSTKTYYYSTHLQKHSARLQKTDEIVSTKGLGENQVINDYSYASDGRLMSMKVKILTDNILNVTEKHLLDYDAVGRVISNRITRQDITGSLSEETHMHKYDENDYLRETVISNGEFQTIRIYQPLIDDIQITEWISINKNTGRETSRLSYQSFYEKGNCLLAHPLGQRVIESTFVGTPFSADVGCVRK